MDGKYITKEVMEFKVEGMYYAYMLRIPKGSVIETQDGYRCILVDGTRHYLGHIQYGRVVHNLIKYTSMAEAIYSNG